MARSEPFALSLFGREVIRFGRAAASAGSIKIPVGSPMGNLLGGMGAFRWGYPQESSKTARLASYTGYVHTCVSARAKRDATARYWLIDKRDGKRIAEDKLPVPYGFFRRPNPVMSEYFLKVLISTFVNLCGTAYVLKVRNAIGVPVMQWPLLPNRVTAMYDAVDWVRYEYQDDSGRTVKIPGADIIAYRWPHPTKLFDGLGPLEGAGLFHDTDVLLWQFQREMFSKGPFSSWILQYPEGARIEDAQKRNVAEAFEAIVGDREHPAYPVVLGEGAEAKQFPVTNKGLEVPSINEEVKERIRSAFGVSKTILGEVPGESRANVEGAELSFVRFTEAYLRLIDEENERSVLPEWDERLSGEFDDVNPADKDFGLRQETADLTAKVLTINEVRERRGLESVEWGDVPWGNFGDVQISESGADEGDGQGAGSAPAGTDVQKTALNGAQMEAAKATLIDVGAGVLSKPSAIALLTLSFPDVDASALAAMVNAVEIKDPAPVPDALKPFAGNPAAAPVPTKDDDEGDDKGDDENDEPEGRQARAGIPEAERRAALYRSWLAVQNPAERAALKAIRREFKRQESIILARLEDKAPRFLHTLAECGSRERAEALFTQRSTADVIADMGEFREGFKKSLEAILTNLYAGAGKKAAKQVGFNAFQVDAGGIRAVANHLQKSTDTILQTSFEAIRDTLKEGFLAGEGVDELAGRIRDVYEGMSAGRAAMIARTETVYPANLGALDGYKQAGVETKEWLTTLDGNERETHGAADGQRVGIDDDFSVGGESLSAPGDPRGSAANSINCRCTIAAIGPGIEEGE